MPNRKRRRNDHVAIMKKSWRLLEKIQTGEKTIESRWYTTKRAPWGAISSGDTVYFKNSGEPVTLKATVANVLAFEDLTPRKVKTILHTYAKPDGIAREDISAYYALFKNKKYCLLIFLNRPRYVRPFGINKSGFGAMAAWITLQHIDQIKKVEN